MRKGQLFRDDFGQPINGLSLSQDMKFAIVSLLNSRVVLFDIEAGEVIQDYHGSHCSDKYTSSTRFSHCDGFFYQASEDGSVCLYDILQKRCV